MVAKCKECQNEVYVADRFRHCFTGYCYKCEAQREDSDFVIDDMGIGIGIVATIAIAKYPLHEWRYNESEVDSFLKKRGIHNPLYNHFTRTGCYFCPKQSKRSLYMLYKHYPKHFETMLEWEAKAKELNCVNQTWIPYKSLSLQQKEFRFLDSQDTEPLFQDRYITEHESCFCGR